MSVSWTLQAATSKKGKNQVKAPADKLKIHKPTLDVTEKVDLQASNY